MKRVSFLTRIFLFLFIYSCSVFQISAQQLSLDSRALQHYSSSEVAELSSSKIEKVNFYYSNSFEVKKGDKLCASCPDLDPNQIDVSLLENRRHEDRKVSVFMSEPGYPVILLSGNELNSSLGIANPYPSELQGINVDSKTNLFHSIISNESFSITYKAEFGKGLRLDFTSFRSEAGFDVLKVYDGKGSSKRLIGQYSGSGIPQSVTTSSQYMTFVFNSDASVSSGGWSATVIPVNPQSMLPPNNQDCQGAIPVCQSVFTQPTSYSGTGNVPNEINPSINCLLSGEKNDVWYQFTVQTSGNLCFSITPNNFSEDYDWAVYNLTNANCADIYNNASLQVSCNYSGAGGVTGANGNGGSQNNPCIAVTAGQSFVLNVSNFSSSQNGYSLDFSQSSAQLFDNVPPQINSYVTPLCGATSLTFNFSENILCSTVSAADFTVTGPGGPYNVTGVSGVGCSAGAPSENTFTITLSQPLIQPGSYSICLNNTAGSVTDLCTNVAPPGCLNFSIADITASFAPVATQCLTGNSFNFTNTSTSTASGTMTYSWSFPGASPSTSTAINPTGVSWSAAGTYTVSLTVTQGGCSETYTQNVSVLLPATAGSASASPAFICAGTCTNLTLTGYQGGIEWQSASASGGPYTNIPGGTTTPFSVCPTAITFYRANVIGCSNATSNYVQVSVNPAPNVQIPVNHHNICQGSSTTISATGAAVYTWNPGPSSGANLTVSPSSTTTYTVTGTSAGCRDTAIAVVNVNLAPNVSTGPDLSTCQGSPVIITATGANTYTWYPATGLSSTSGSSVTANPSSTITYTITGTSAAACYDYDTIIVNVLPPPIANAGSDIQICAGTPGTLIASGGTTYSWSPSGSLSSPTGSTVQASPVATTTYTVTASIGSCTSTDEVVVDVVPMPVAAAGSDVTICSGTGTTLSASGGTDYSWTPPVNLTSAIGPSVVASPMSTTTYTVTASNSNCISTDEVIVNVITSPVTDAGPDKFICITQSDTLTATGAITYSWTPSAGLNVSTGPQVIASPSVTTTYTVTGSDNMCFSVDYTVVHVQTSISVIASADQQICYGDTANLLVNGAFNYNWTPPLGLSSTTDSVLVASPLATTTYTVSGTTNGCYGSDEVIVNVLPLPSVSAGADVSICFGSQSTLSATGATTYTWNPALGLDNASSASPVASPAITTTYTLTGTTAAGCINYDTMVVFVNVLPVADFIVQDTCEYLPFNFIDNSTIASGAISSWFWDFGDMGSNSPLQNPSHQYASEGQYSVTLVVQSNAIPSCAAVITKTVNVYPKPVAGFSVTDVCHGFESAFTNSSSVVTGSIAQSSWNFGDGNSSVLTSPLHAYNAPGSYTAELIVTTDHSCKDTISHTLNVFEKPVADFISDSVCLGFATSLTSTSQLSTGSIQTYQWDLDGEGTAAVSNTQHIFLASGIRNVELIITSDNGCKDTIAKPVIVHDKPIAQFSSTAVCVGNTTQFSDMSTVNAPSTFVGWNWSFGDGNASSSPDPVNIYAGPGNYIAGLIIETNFGCKDTFNTQVTVFANPIPQISSNSVAGCSPVCIIFRDTTSSASPVQSWSWNFGDNSTLVTDQHPVHCFDAGEFDVTLSVTTVDGCSAQSSTYHISSYPLPVAGFIYGPQTISIVNPIVSFTDGSIGATSWSWNFGDNDTASFNGTMDMIEHEYGDTGTYCVNLVVLNNYGCRDSIEHCLTVDPDYVIYTPNAFTPNGDGKNEVFIPVTTGVSEKAYEMRIYDRWGNLVFLTNDLSKGWNGKFNNTGSDAPEDVYVFMIHFKDLNGVPKRVADKVTLLR